MAADSALQRYADATPNAITVRAWADQRVLFEVKDNDPEPAPFFSGTNFLYSAWAYGIRVWNVTNGAVVFSMEAAQPERRFLGRALGPGSAVFAVGDAQGILRVYGLTDEKLVWETQEISEPGALSFSPDENLLAVECLGEVQVWNWREKTLTHRLKKPDAGLERWRGQAMGSF